VRELALLGLLVVICVGFGTTVEGFWDAQNLLDRSRYWVEMGAIAVVMTLVIGTGGIDLSVGSMLALAATTAGVLWRDASAPIWLAAVAGVAAGTLAGAFNGLSIHRLGMPPLVVTLATMAAFRGLAVGVMQADPVRNLPASFQELGQGDFVAMPMQLPLLILAGTIGILALGRSWIGPALLAMGDNPVAARFAGLPIGRLTVGLYAASGMVCGLAGIVYMARYGSINAEIAGRGLELEVIACVVIGGTRIVGGSASVAGTLIGVLILDLFRFGLELSSDTTGIGSKQQMIIIGAVVVVTAVLNEWWARRAAREG